MIIKDIFGNSIIVTDLNAAISQTKCFIGWSKAETMIFDEFKLVPTQDIYGKPTTVKCDTKSGKSCTNLEYYTHQLTQLNKHN